MKNLTIISLLLLSITASSQYTSNRFLATARKANEYGALELRHRFLSLDTSLCIYLLKDSVFFNKMSADSDFTYEPREMVIWIDSNYFYKGRTPSYIAKNNIFYCTNNAIDFEENIFEDVLDISGVGQTKYNCLNQTPGFFFNNNRSASLSFSLCRFQNLTIKYNKLGDSALPNIQLGISHSTIYGSTEIEYNSTTRNGSYKFTTDSFLSDCSIRNSVHDDANLNNCNFYNCHFSDILFCSQFKKIVFEYCSSGDRFTFDGVADTIVVSNCNDFKIYIDKRPFLKFQRIKLCIVNSNLNNIDFDYSYSSPFDLIFPEEYDSTELGSQTYQNLLARFKAENKKQSYERLDKEFHKYKVWKPWAKIQELYWDFGYAKWNVVFWTLVAILLFAISNLFVWKWMKVTYNFDEKLPFPIRIISPNYSGKWYRYVAIEHPKYILRWLRNLLYAYIYTCTIFFSLKVNKSNLRYGNRYMLIWYFIQYIVGVASIFFFVNVVLKTA